jgi:hypothetical protein
MKYDNPVIVILYVHNDLDIEVSPPDDDNDDDDDDIPPWLVPQVCQLVITQNKLKI